VVYILDVSAETGKSERVTFECIVSWTQL